MRLRPPLPTCPRSPSVGHMHLVVSSLRRAAARRPGPTLLVLALVTLVLGWLSTQAVLATGDVDLSSGSEPSVAAARIAERFGEADAPVLVQVAVTGEDVLSTEGLATATALRDAVLTDPAIGPLVLAGPEGATGITTWIDPVAMALAQQGIDPTTLDDAAIAAAHADTLAALPPEQAAGVVGLVSADRDAGMVVVMLDPAADDDALEAAQLAFGDLDVATPPDVEVHPFNLELLNAESQQAVEEQMSRLLGLAMLLIVLILVAINRNVVDVVSSLVGLVLAIVWMNGIGTLLGPGFLGITAGMGEMTTAIPILLVGLGVDYGIHLSSRFREERGHGASSTGAASAAIGAVGTALVLATITTVVGFLTNLANPLTPLRDFGLLAAVGVVCAFLVMTTIVPAARLVADGWYERRKGVPRPVTRTAEHGPGLLGRAAAGLAPLAADHPRRVLVVAGLVTLGAGLSATNLTTTFSQTEFFPEGSDAVATIELFEREFGGDLAETTQVLVEGDGADDAIAMRAFLAAVAEAPDVRSVDGVALADVRATATGDAVVVTLQTSAGEDVGPLEETLRDAAEVFTDDGLEVRLTSTNLLITAVMDDLRDSQVTGLVLTLAASMAILALAFWVRRRAPMLGVLAIAAVALVTVWVLGIMSLAGIPFNMMTAMISALAIGIGVPFGIHVVNRFLEEHERSPDLRTAVEATLSHTGGALVGSAVTTMAGFGVLSLSTIRPMQQFGIVTALTIGLALVSSVAVLPALLVLWARANEQDQRLQGTTGSAPDGDAADEREAVHA